MSNPGRFKPLAPTYSSDLYAGTAQFYASYRVEYPSSLLRDLCSRAQLSGNGKLLDLACGPGRLTLPLSQDFEEAIGVDQEPEMVEVGREGAQRRGITNVRWKVGRAEDLRIPLSSIELITIGEAFHRLHQVKIAELSFKWLKPGCCLSTLGGVRITGGSEPWQALVREVLGKWTRKDIRPKSEELSGEYDGRIHDGQILEEAGFVDIQNHQFTHPYEWTTDSIIGVIYSGAGDLRGSLGDRSKDFELELISLLLSHHPEGKFAEQMSFGYTLARKPA